jgi:hypothetical protein
MVLIFIKIYKQKKGKIYFSKIKMINLKIVILIEIQTFIKIYQFLNIQTKKCFLNLDNH